MKYASPLPTYMNAYKQNVFLFHMYLTVGTWYKQNCLILLNLVSVFECYLFPYNIKFMSSCCGPFLRTKVVSCLKLQCKTMQLQLTQCYNCTSTLTAMFAPILHLPPNISVNINMMLQVGFLYLARLLIFFKH